MVVSYTRTLQVAIRMAQNIHVPWLFTVVTDLQPHLNDVYIYIYIYINNLSYRSYFVLFHAVYNCEGPKLHASSLHFPKKSPQRSPRSFQQASPVVGQDAVKGIEAAGNL